MSKSKRRRWLEAKILEKRLKSIPQNRHSIGDLREEGMLKNMGALLKPCGVHSRICNYCRNSKIRYKRGGPDIEDYGEDYRP